LEDQPEFNYFSDVVRSYPLVSGLRHMEEEPDKKATFVGNFKLTPFVKGEDSKKSSPWKIPTFLAKHQTWVIARIYIVRALRLCPKDSNGLSDPYIVISNEDRLLCKDRENFIPENLNPIFGQ
jgi:hypothetical protein